MCVRSCDTDTIAVFTLFAFSTQESSGSEIAENICGGVTAPAKATGVINYSCTTVTWILIKKNKCARRDRRKAAAVITCPVWDFSQVQIRMAGTRPKV